MKNIISKVLRAQCLAPLFLKIIRFLKKFTAPAEYLKIILLILLCSCGNEVDDPILQNDYVEYKSMQQDMQ